MFQLSNALKMGVVLPTFFTHGNKAESDETSVYILDPNVPLEIDLYLSIVPR